jgi:2-methylcitrate dehydratase
LGSSVIDGCLAGVERLPELGPGELDQLNITAAPGVIDLNAAPKGLF